MHCKAGRWKLPCTSPVRSRRHHSQLRSQALAARTRLSLVEIFLHQCWSVELVEDVASTMPVLIQSAEVHPNVEIFDELVIL